MFWIAVVFMTIVFLGGIGRLLLFLRGQGATLPKSETSLTREKILSLSIVAVACGTLGLLSLYLGILGPVEAIVGVLLIVSLMEVAIRAGTVKSTGQTRRS